MRVLQTTETHHARHASPLLRGWEGVGIGVKVDVDARAGIKVGGNDDELEGCPFSVPENALLREPALSWA